VEDLGFQIQNKLAEICQKTKEKIVDQKEDTLIVLSPLQ
jgi:hypothetical protein